MTESNGAISCPVPLHEHRTILLAHGGGGRLTRDLIEHTFLERFSNRWLAPLHDGAVLDEAGVKIAMTTDSFVVRPLFFPGGDIGALAVHGTVNDLAMCAARPLGLSAGFIIEEGLPIEVLERVTQSMADAAKQVAVPIVTGDTKVVDRGKGDGLYINTSGVGVVESSIELSPHAVQVGDRILVSGAVGNHGVAVMSAREGLEFETVVESDTAPLWRLVEAMLSSSQEIRCLRDPTRGGLATVALEIAEACGAGLRLTERAIPIEEGVLAACEILGLDPLYVPCEGRLMAIVAPNAAERLLKAMRAHDAQAAMIGEVVAEPRRIVTLVTAIGGERVLDLLSGEQLPRIC